jgi:putative radical SAM enzyme (TIGR03279 family)
MTRFGIRVLEIEAGSIARKLRLSAGDTILSINGHDVTDELSLKFWLGEEPVKLEVLKANGGKETLNFEIPEGAGLGIKVEDFKTRLCNNSCLFCFVDQLPAGARSSLRIKDDDYRLSFLHGNYITLTNLQDKDLDHIIELALSPLYVSVHATEPRLRTFMLGRKKADDLDYKMRKLIRGGIKIHAQIVLMPGINDGRFLENTIKDLYEYYPGVNSVAIVPLGLSDHGVRTELHKPVTPAFCRRLVRQIIPWQEKFRKETGRTFTYLADEFYLQGGFPFPAKEHYDDFAQIEDGIGMVRKFLGEFETELARRRKARSHLHATLVTGRLFYPYLKYCIDRFNEKLNARLAVIAAKNRYLGKNITVAGLLGGGDIIRALRKKDLGNFVVIPEEVVSRSEDVLVDDVSLQQIEHELGVRVYASGRTMRQFFALLCEMPK